MQAAERRAHGLLAVERRPPPPAACKEPADGWLAGWLMLLVPPCALQVLSLASERPQYSFEPFDWQ